MDKEASDLFDALYLQITEQDLVQRLSEVQNLYESSIEDPKCESKLLSKWTALRKRLTSSAQNKAFATKKFELRSITQNIQSVFQKLSSKAAIPNDGYVITVKSFREEFQSVKALLVQKSFSESFVEITKKFVSNFNNEYRNVFNTAKLDAKAKLSMLNTLDLSLSDFERIIEWINNDESLIQSVVELSKLMNSFENNNNESNDEEDEDDDDDSTPDIKNNKNMKNHGFKMQSSSSSSEEKINKKNKFLKDVDVEEVNENENDDDDDNNDDNDNDNDDDNDDDNNEIEEEEIEKIHGNSSDSLSDNDFDFNSSDHSSSAHKEVKQSFLDGYLSQLADISTNIINLLGRPNNSKDIREEAEKLNSLAQKNLFQEFNIEKKRLNREIKRSREMISLLNKAQSMRTNMSNEVLQKFSKDDLIVLIQGFVANNEEIKVPIELTVAKGTPSEFKELASKYMKASKFNEEASAEINRMNVAIIQLRSENQRLKCQAAAMSNEASIHNELDQMNSQILQIQTLISNNPKNVFDLQNELADLENKRKQTLSQLDGYDKYDLHMQVEMLKSEIGELQRVIEDKIKENESLQADMKALSQRIAKKEAQENKVEQHPMKEMPKIVEHKDEQKNMNIINPNVHNKVAHIAAEPPPQKEANIKPTPRAKPKKKMLKSAYSQKNIRKIWDSHKDVIRVNRPPFRS